MSKVAKPHLLMRTRRMKPVFLAGRGLACALGLDLEAALLTLRRGGAAPNVRPGAMHVSSGWNWPYHAIADSDADSDADANAGAPGAWLVRARRIIEGVARASGALAGPRDGALFVGSSSLDIGICDDGGALLGDCHRLAEQAAAWLDWRGAVYTVSTACTSSLNALLSAHAQVRDGHAEHALVLGIELRNRVSVGGFGGMQLLSPCRALPLGAGRDGLVLGEAVAALHVSAAPARWRIAGGANVVDGRDAAGCVPAAVIAMCQQALAAAGLQAHEIDLIKPQAAGSPGNDAAEILALRAVFEPMPQLIALKGLIGHTLGASGAAEIALLTACLESGVWPGADYPIDAALQVCLAQDASHSPQPARHVLASILGFGGGHAAVVLQDNEA